MKTGSSDGDNNPDEIMVDPDYAIYAEDGTVIGQFDDDGKETFFKGKEPKKEAEDQGAPEVKGEEKPQDKPEDKKEEENQEPEFINHAHFILKRGGYDQDEIEFENGERVAFADLTQEQQLNIITSEFSRMQEEYEAEISQRPEAPKLSEDAKALVDFLENGGTAKDLAKYILDNDPDNAHKSLTDDDLVLESVRKSMPGASEEDVQEEFKILKDAGRVEKRAQLLRRQLASGEINLSDISQKHAEARRLQQSKELEYEIEDAKKLTEYAKKVDNVAGVPVDPSVINSVLKNLIPEKPGEDSEFLKSLHNPEKLLRYQFLDQYAEKIMEHVANESMKEGVALERQRLQSRIEELEEQLNIKNKHLAKFSDQPLVQFGKPSKKQTTTEPVSEEF